MNFFKRLFSSAKKSKEPIASIVEKEPKNKTENYINLAVALLENNYPEIIEKYIEKLNQFNTNPELIFDGDEYYYDTKTTKFQAYRGEAKEIKENIEWFLLIDTFQFNKIIWELDWKSEHKEVNAVLKILAEKKGHQINDLNEINSEGMQDLDEYFNAVNEKLKTDSLVAIELYIDSDSYVMGVLKTSNLEKVIDLALICKQKIITY